MTPCCFRSICSRLYTPATSRYLTSGNRRLTDVTLSIVGAIGQAVIVGRDTIFVARLVVETTAIRVSKLDTSPTGSSAQLTHRQH